MNKELKKKLEHIKNNPSTDSVFNAQLLATQVETIFMLDRLNKTIRKSNVQSVRYNNFNRRLQFVMLILTFVMAWATILPLVNSFIGMIKVGQQEMNQFPGIQLSISSFVTLILTVILTWWMSKELEKMDKEDGLK